MRSLGVLWLTLLSMSMLEDKEQPRWLTGLEEVKSWEERMENGQEAKPAPGRQAGWWESIQVVSWGAGGEGLAQSCSTHLT